jgi:hypothetical protein
MHFLAITLRQGRVLSPASAGTWRVLQLVIGVLGAGLLLSLLFFPALGLAVFWNILIPVAPLLFVLALGVWRNICPLATVNLLPRHFGLSGRKKPTQRQAGIFNLMGVIALFVIVPLRHPVFNHNGQATALLILSMVAIGTGLGFVYEWKSAWCSGLCPIHPVEKLYGGQTAFTVPNTHCRQCMNCVVPCPDSTPAMHPLLSKNSVFHTISGMLIVGGLPGFIWGWFHVPDNNTFDTGHGFLQTYTLPFTGLLVTLLVFLVLQQFAGKEYEKRLVGLFASASVTCYYWYRLPALFGFGEIADDGLLYDLSGILPPVFVPVTRILVVSLFFYWFMLRTPGRKSWTMRPAFAREKP